MTSPPRPSASTGLLVAGAVLLVGLIDEVLGVVQFDLWRWLVVSGIAVAAALVALSSSLEAATPRRARVGRVAGSLSGFGAAAYLLVTFAFWSATVVGVALPQQLEGLFAVGALVFLLGAVTGLVALGTGVLRGRGGGRSAGGLLIGSGLLMTGSLTGLVDASVPSWAPLSIVGSLAVTVLAAGMLLRTDASHVPVPPSSPAFDQDPPRACGERTRGPHERA